MFGFSDEFLRLMPFFELGIIKVFTMMMSHCQRSIQRIMERANERPSYCKRLSKCANGLKRHKLRSVRLARTVNSGLREYGRKPVDKLNH